MESQSKETVILPPREALDLIQDHFYPEAIAFKGAKTEVERRQHMNNINALLDAHLDISADIFGQSAA